MTPEEQLRTVSERAGFVRTVSKGMYCKTGEDVDGGFGNLIASQILKQNFGFTSTQRLVQFSMSKIICHRNVHGIEIQIPQHLERKTPKFGWSYPDAQIVAWMSYDTESQKIFLKKLLNNVCKIKRNSLHKVEGQMTTFLFIKEFGRTCQPMNTVADTTGKPKSRNLSVNWYDMRIREKERQMEQFIGNAQKSS